MSEDLAWGYAGPLPGVTKITDLICCYNEKVDLIVDGEWQQRPAPPWS